MTDTELRRAVAEKLVGYRITEEDDGRYSATSDDEPVGGRYDSVQECMDMTCYFSLRDLADRALDEMAGVADATCIITDTYVSFQNTDSKFGMQNVSGKPSEAFPKAVCLAYLAWKGVNV